MKARFSNDRFGLNFPIKYFIRPFLSLFPVCFPVSTRQIVCYPPCKNRKTSSKTILKPQAEQNLNSYFYSLSNDINYFPFFKYNSNIILYHPSRFCSIFAYKLRGTNGK